MATGDKVIMLRAGALWAQASGGSHYTSADNGRVEGDLAAVNRCYTYIREAGTFGGAGIKVQANATTSGTGTVKWYHETGGGTPSLTISVAYGTTGWFSTTDTYTFDIDYIPEYTYWHFSNATGGTCTWGVMAQDWRGASECTTYHSSWLAQAIGSGSTRYLPVAGCNYADNNTTNTNVTLDYSSTVDNFGASITTNNFTTADTILYPFINSSSATSFLTISAGTTGMFFNTTDSEVIGTGQTFCWRAEVDIQAGKTITFEKIMCRLTSDDSHYPNFNSAYRTGTSLGTTDMDMGMPVCEHTSIQSPKNQFTASHSFTLNKLRVKPFSNSMSTNTGYVKVMDNTTATGISVTVTGSATTELADTSNSYTFDTSDLVSIFWDGAAGGTWYASYSQVFMQEYVAPTTVKDIIGQGFIAFKR